LINLRLNKRITKRKKAQFKVFKLACCFWIGLMCFGLSSFSNIDSTNLYIYYVADAELFASALQFKQAELNYQKAINYCDSLKNWTGKITLRNQLTKLWILTAEYERADSLLALNTKEIQQKLKRKTTHKRQLNYLKSLLQYKQGEYEGTLKRIQSTLKNSKPKAYADSLQIAQLYELKGWVNMEFSRYNEAFEWFQKGYALHPKNNTKLDVAGYHFNIGMYFFKIKDFENAENYLDNSLKIRNNELHPQDPLIADAQYWLGKLYVRENKLFEADSLLNACLTTRISAFKQNSVHPAIAESYEGLAQMYQQQGNYADALRYFELGIEVYKKTFPSGHPHVGKLYNNRAIVQEAINNYQDAYKSYTKALGIFKKSYGEKHLYYLNCLNNLGLLNMNAGKYKTARSNFEQAILITEELPAYKMLLEKLYYDMAILFFRTKNYNKMNECLSNVKNISFDQYIELSKMHYPNKNYADVVRNLDLAETLIDQYNFSNQADLSYWRAKANYALFKENKDFNNLQNAQKAIQNCNIIIQQRRQEVGELLRFNEMIRPAYKLGLQIFDTGYQTSNDPVFIDYAFQFINNSKANVLLSRLNDQKAMQLGLSPELIEIESSYRKQINHLNNSVRSENKRNVDSIQHQLKTDSIQQQLIKVKKDYKAFKQQLEKEHLPYYKIKYDTTRITIAQIQANIDNSTSVIEYFISDDFLYIVQIEKKDKRLFKIPKPVDLFERIDTLRLAINWGLSDNIPPADIFNQFIANSHSLYTDVLAKPLEAITNKTIEELLIIPDNQLNYLPFDLLLSSEVESKEINYNILPYVMQKYAVGYAYSSSFITNEYKKLSNQPTLNYLGYAPKYEDTPNQTNQSIIQNTNRPNLIHARKSVQIIDSLLEGKSYIDEAASKRNFLENLNHAKILHLAMHAEVDDENPYNSKLIFGNEDLTVGDLNTLQINADLVALTACNTGSGQLENGEGVMSLSRAFAYAGCPSVVMSLWSLPDKQTAYLSELFFTNLKSGLNKHQALRQAKLTYLQNPTDDITTHPFFWGGLVATGNMQPVFMSIENNYTFNWYWCLLILPLFWYLIKFFK